MSASVDAKPRLNRIDESASSRGTPMAASTCDGSVAPESLSGIIEATAASQFSDEVRAVAGTGPEADAHALVGSESTEDKS